MQTSIVLILFIVLWQVSSFELQ